MTRFKLVIFDCDGVLVDSERISIQVDRAMLAEVGWHLTESDILERFLGRSHAHMVHEIESHLGRPLPAGWEDEYHAAIDRAFEASLTAVDGVEQALDRIGTPTCVASSSTHERLRRTLGMSGLYHLFEGRVFSSTEVSRGKPAPDLFLHAARRLGVAPADCAVVEDSPSGVRAARSAGMTVFGYVGGVTPASWLAGSGAEMFDDMRLLPDLLARG
ncbi:HAD family hydrolase [Streptomyces sp. NPDC020731]|uniref:HAD family hydrolase n=1 Tax=Streptomyces sp. NPDC020731 TaxID=3365085 RepID=UPI003790726C